MMILKLIVAITWVLSLGSFVFAYPEPWDIVAFWVVTGLIGIHALECIVFSKRVEASNGNKVSHYMQVFLFGYLHANTLPEVK